MSVWVGLVGVLLGSLLTGAVAVYHDRQRGARERTEAREARQYQREERRYEDRLKAYAELEAVVVRKVRQAAQWEMQNPGMTPSDLGFDELAEVEEFTDALIQVRLLGSAPVRDAAEALDQVMPDYVYGGLTYDQLLVLWQRFRDAARADLAGG